ncbi:MAG: 30S ribosomal protein S8 [Myxococcota bacterium]|nr:30S ribosomal protein S8 [Myxococcota bacterium]
MHSDPIADFLTRLRNASMAGHETVLVPQSKMKMRLSEILKQEGFIGDFHEVRGKPHDHLEVSLRYDKQNKALISGLERVSKPGLRCYLKATEIPKVRNGLGVMIMTTSQGLMSDRKARAEGIGGEALCAVW